MTPQEKAKELLVNFSFLQYNQTTGKTIGGAKGEYLRKCVIQCALIATDEKIEVLDEIELKETGKIIYSYGQDYYLQVKEELQKE